ncbi:protein FAM3C-like [Boleophthalmus pectinirostris]|uniref:protein FAM3C-like n=1 Tax=Boleophthalmus pectinirostris TaxID=150288 RepID=UPI000A1C6918|nr:protein FAM3C-like [Boleophthalmus pectinirostris]
MLQVRIGRSNMPRPSVLRFWRFIAVALVVASFSIFLLQKYSEIISVVTVPEKLKMEKKTVNPCPTLICSKDHFSFYIQSGAANVVPPKICFRNQLFLGKEKQNTGTGINAVILNGTTGELVHTGYYDMYSGDSKPLIELLQKTETGSIILMASFDEPSSKLNEEARQLILDLGSSSVKSLGFRDNWIFVGGKGLRVKSTFEKHIKNDPKMNKYETWPELIELSGCIPKYMS